MLITRDIPNLLKNYSKFTPSYKRLSQKIYLIIGLLHQSKKQSNATQDNATLPVS